MNAGNTIQLRCRRIILQRQQNRLRWCIRAVARLGGCDQGRAPQSGGELIPGHLGHVNLLAAELDRQPGTAGSDQCVSRLSRLQGWQGIEGDRLQLFLDSDGRDVALNRASRIGDLHAITTGKINGRIGQEQD